MRLHSLACSVATRAVEQLLDGFQRYPPNSDDYMEQFADRLPDEAARQRVREAFDRIQVEVIDKAMTRSGQLIDREDITETLEVIPRRWKVIQTVREKFSCRHCETITQPPAPFHVTPRGFAGPNLLAMMFSPAV